MTAPGSKDRVLVRRTAGAFPHVLHFMLPLAGMAYVTGVGGTLLSAGIGLVVAMPLLWYDPHPQH